MRGAAREEPRPGGFTSAIWTPVPTIADGINSKMRQPSITNYFQRQAQPLHPVAGPPSTRNTSNRLLPTTTSPQPPPQPPPLKPNSKNVDKLHHPGVRPESTPRMPTKMNGKCPESDPDSILIRDEDGYWVPVPRAPTPNPKMSRYPATFHDPPSTLTLIANLRVKMPEPTTRYEVSSDDEGEESTEEDGSGEGESGEEGSEEAGWGDEDSDEGEDGYDESTHNRRFNSPTEILSSSPPRGTKRQIRKQLLKKLQDARQRKRGGGCLEADDGQGGLEEDKEGQQEPRRQRRKL